MFIWNARAVTFSMRSPEKQVLETDSYAFDSLLEEPL
jgi:hypothetical protein